MDINAINDNIIELENSETTFDNVSELASLYIVQEHLQKTKNEQIQHSTDKIENELQDILPYYHRYCKIKRKYQAGELSEIEVLKSIKDVCTEITEFIQILYSGTDMRGERTEIEKMLRTLSNKYS